jgi:photosystem II stability/assembly factor-like uncharacterized protein
VFIQARPYLPGVNLSRFMLSQDAGLTWTVARFRTGGAEQNYLNGIDVKQIVFANPQVGWMLGTAAELFKTRDGGRTWVPQGGVLPAGEEITALLVDDENRATLLTNNPAVRYVTDTGGE